MLLLPFFQRGADEKASHQPIGHPFRLRQKFLSDIPLGLVQNTPKGRVALLIFRQQQIGQQILGDPVLIYIPALVPQVIGDAPLVQLPGKSPALQVRAVDDGDFLHGHALIQQHPYFFAYACRFSRHVLRQKKGHLRPFFPNPLHVFGKAQGIVSNDPLRQGNDPLRGSVIDLQRHLFRPGIPLGKIQQKIRPCPPESINALVIIPHHEQVFMLLRQYTQTFKLGLVHILKFIHQNEAVFPLPIGPGSLVLRQQFIAKGQHIVKIYFFMTLLISFISVIQLPKFLPWNARRRKGPHLLQFTFHQRKLSKKYGNIFFHIGHIPLGLLHQMPQHIPSFLLLKHPFQPPAVAAAQDAEKNAVEGAEGNALGAAGLCEAFLHFLCCRPGKGQRQNFLGLC